MHTFRFQLIILLSFPKLGPKDSHFANHDNGLSEEQLQQFSWLYDHLSTIDNKIDINGQTITPIDVKTHPNFYYDHFHFIGVYCT